MPRRILPILLLFLYAQLTFVPTTHALQDGFRVSPAKPNDPDEFGTSAVIEGDYALITAPNALNSQNVRTGAVYVYKKKGIAWELKAKLVPANENTIREFGSSVDMNGSRAIVSNVDGDVYIFKRVAEDWQQESKLPNTSGNNKNLYFYRQKIVGIWGDYAVVGATHDQSPYKPGYYFGAARIYQRFGNAWFLQTTLGIPNPDILDDFGFSVAIEGDTVAVSAANQDHHGAVYIFRLKNNSWVPTQQLLPDPDGADYSRFGTSISIDGDNMLISDDGDVDNNQQTSDGYVRRYKKVNDLWTLQEEWPSLLPGPLAGFGTLVSLSGNNALVLDSKQGYVWNYLKTNNDWNFIDPLYDYPPNELPYYSGADAISLHQCKAVVGRSHSMNGAGDALLFDLNWDPREAISPENNQAKDLFGRAAAVSGNLALIGAPWHRSTIDQSGAAYIYKKTSEGWQQVVQLISGNTAPVGALFGSAVAISGSTAVVGSPGENVQGINSGAVDVFHFGPQGWMLEARLKASYAAAGQFFGQTVAVYNDLILVGAYGDDQKGQDAGAVYAFRRTNNIWKLIKKLQASDAAAGDNFGSGLAITANYAAIGAPGDDDLGANSGAAYIFKWDGQAWNQQAKLKAQDGKAGDAFGLAVATNGSYAVLGAMGHDGPGGINSGAAYVFAKTNEQWTQKQMLVADDAKAGQNFGSAVAISAPRLMVGASRDSGVAAQAGAAYVFSLQDNQWIAIDKLAPNDAKSQDGMGAVVAMDSDDLLLPAAWRDANGSDSGLVYFYGPDCF